MKFRNIALLTLMLLSGQVWAGAINAALPERIKPISKVAYSQAYYAEQAKLWKMETEKNTLNADAWLNYYFAARYANMLDQSPSFALTEILTQMPKQLENSFEYQFIRFLNAPWDESRYAYLLKAHEIAPQRTEVYRDMATYHLTQGDQSQAAFYLQKLFDAGEFPGELLAWNFNLLASAEADAILLTYGDNDTYPLWVLQSAKGIRKDIKVLNINLLLMDEYREREFAKLGIPAVDLSKCTSSEQMYQKVMRQIMSAARQSVYVANTLPEGIRLMFGDSLYLTGLAFRYATNSFDNLAILKNNFENKFLLDYLRVDFSPDSISSIMSGMNLQYLPAFILLHQHYLASGDKSKAASLEPVMTHIAQEGGREEALASYLEATDGDAHPLETSISVRSLDKGIKKIIGTPNLYAFETEVTNAQYEAFLMDLVKNKEFNKLATCQAPRTDWRSLLPEEFKNLPDSEVFKFAHPDEAAAPIVNVSHEAAREYCDWITKVYNASTDKKKSYRKVRFRLPTESEWELAARAGRKDTPYPWGGYYVRNNKGCFLGNYDVYKEEPCKGCDQSNTTDAQDGGFFTVKADSYFPNDFGLYNMSGNVAEMIDQPGVTKGGSWNEAPFYGQIGNRNTYTKPAPFIGFRVFMETIE